MRNIEKIAPTDVTPYCCSARAVPEGMLAQAIHKMSGASARRSSRSTAPPFPKRCSKASCSVTKGRLYRAVKQNIGRIESADRGTLVPDEIGDVPLPMQVKLLRFLQDRSSSDWWQETVQVDVRIVCATNQDLDRLMAEGRFRDDLYYRLNEVTVRVPPLRERLAMW